MSISPREALSPSGSPRAAAFFRVEGPLLRRTAAFTAAWLAGNSQAIGGRLSRLGAVALSAPLRLSDDPVLATRAAFLGLRGMSEDRLEILGEEFFETWVRDRLREAGLDLIRKARAQGRQVVLVSDSVEVVMRHLAALLEADALVCNRLERRNGRATGRLLDPVVGRFGGEPLRRWAQQHAIDLHTSCGYGGNGIDAALLSGVGLPCAVYPDRSLRKIARDLGWPVVEG